MRVLLATDGSDFSDAAIRSCIRFAKTGDITAIRVICVYEAQIPIAAEPLMVSSGYYDQLNEVARKRAHSIAAGAVEMLAAQLTDFPIDIATTVKFGEPASAIVDVAKEWEIDLIIVGSHGRGFLGRLALGSVSDAVVHNAPCSVLVARN